ncbi:hypothetical protein N8500_04725 [Candidatus Puniceispirillum sp.]|nr:hypothetical protein [Candidatus Puniceispirillum sp.]
MHIILLKLVTLIALGMTTSGCQMLLDNRENGMASVVVVPTAEWDKMQQDKLRLEITQNMDESSREDKLMPLAPTPIVPVEGSRLIQFSNRTDSNLAGCSAIGAIEIRHKGTMDDAVIILKNEAHRLSSNILVPVLMEQSETNAYASSIQIEARMMKCPLKLARGN